MSFMDIRFKLLGNGLKAEQSTEGSAGLDLKATLSAPLTIAPNASALVPTGIAIELPKGYCGLICSRSGLAAKHNIFVLNAPGVIDSDYRGEIKVILFNASSEEFIVSHGMRIAQILFVSYEIPHWIPANELSSTLRDSKGFGSTGI